MKPLGLHCIACGKRMLRTSDSRPVNNAVRRIKTCTSCGAEMISIEKIVSMRVRRRRKGEAA